MQHFSLRCTMITEEGAVEGCLRGFLKIMAKFRAHAGHLWAHEGILAWCRCADFVLLNKVDMLKEGDLESLSQIASSLNPLAKVGAATVKRLPFMPSLPPHERPLLAGMV